MESRLVVMGAGRAGGSGMDGEFGVSRREVFYLEWISKEVPLHSVGS